MSSKRAFPCLQVALVLLLVIISLWCGAMLGYALSSSATSLAIQHGSDSADHKGVLRSKSRHESAARLTASAAASRSTPPSMAPLQTLLQTQSKSMRRLAGERIQLVQHTMSLTGHPPLVSRSDVSTDGQPDFANFGLPLQIPAPHFFVVDPDADPHPGDEQQQIQLAKALGLRSTASSSALLPSGLRYTDNPFRYVIRSEDAIRDVVAAILLSPGKQRDGKAEITCKTSPVTAPYACLASLRQSHPALFEGGTGKPVPAAEGGLLVLDIGHTSAGYYSLLASAGASVSSISIDTQPQCSMWASIGAGASGLSSLAQSIAAVPVPPAQARLVDASADSVAARTRTGCLGTSTTESHPRHKDVERYYSSGPRLPNGKAAGDEDHRKQAENGRGLFGIEGPPPGYGLGIDQSSSSSAASTTATDSTKQDDQRPTAADASSPTTDIPVSSVDDLLCAVASDAFCASSSSTHSSAPTVLIAKIDARGREAAVLAGMQNMLGSSSLKPKHLLIELNKQHAAAWMGLPSARKAAIAAGHATSEADADAWLHSEAALVAGYDLLPFDLSAEDNAAVSASYVSLMKQLLSLGYEVLTADRGWWAAQDPFRPGPAYRDKPLSDGTTIESWADALNRRGEVDIWAYLPQ